MTSWKSYLLALLCVVTGNCFVESATVRLTKQCFEIGETINIRFVDVGGEGIFVGVYTDADVPNRQALPPLDSPSLVRWVLTCGSFDNCDSWPSRGLVEMSTDGLQEDTYFIAVSGNRSGLTPQATTRTFQVGDCSNFESVPEPPPTSRPIILGPTQTTIVDRLPETPTTPPVSIPEPEPVPVPVDPTPQPITPTSPPIPIPQPVQSPEDEFIVTNNINFVLNDARVQIENVIRIDDDLIGKVS